MSDDTGRRAAMPSEEEVRRLVRSVVDAVGAEPARGAAAAVTAPAPARPATPAAAAAPTAGSGEAAAVSIAIGGDHGGFALKQVLLRWLGEKGHPVTDCGTHSTDAVDYPDIALAVARLVADGTCSVGIVIDGAGIGSCMAANKVPGVRASLCYDISTARNAREHNYANVLTLGARLIGEGLAMDIVTTWLATPWGAARHGARVDKITAIERTYAAPGTEGRAG
jgi:ribose 5-phosphate isomerase B